MNDSSNYLAAIDEMAEAYANSKADAIKAELAKLSSDPNLNGKDHLAAQLKEREREIFKKEFLELPHVFKRVLILTKNHPDLKEFTDALERNSMNFGASDLVYKMLGMGDDTYSHYLAFAKKAMSTKMKKEALDLYIVATHLNHKSFDAWIGLSVSYLLNSDIEKSLSAAWEAHLLEPNRPGPNICMIECYIEADKANNNPIYREKIEHLLDSFRKLNKFDPTVLSPSLKKILKKYSNYTKNKGGHK